MFLTEPQVGWHNQSDQSEPVFERDNQCSPEKYTYLDPVSGNRSQKIIIYGNNSAPEFAEYIELFQFTSLSWYLIIGHCT